MHLLTQIIVVPRIHCSEVLNLQQGSVLLAQVVILRRLGVEAAPLDQPLPPRLQARQWVQDYSVTQPQVLLLAVVDYLEANRLQRDLELHKVSRAYPL